MSASVEARANEWGSAAARRLGLTPHSWVKFGEFKPEDMSSNVHPMYVGKVFGRFQCSGCRRFSIELVTWRTENGWCRFPEIGGYWAVGGFRGCVQAIDLERGVFTIKNDDGAVREFTVGTPDETPPAELVEELGGAGRDLVVSLDSEATP